MGLHHLEPGMWSNHDELPAEYSKSRYNMICVEAGGVAKILIMNGPTPMTWSTPKLLRLNMFSQSWRI